MRRRLKKVALVFVVLLSVAIAGAQLARPRRTNPPIDFNKTFQAEAGTESEVAKVVDRSCGDCHSNATVWARYTNIAPMSWLIVRGVNEGRKVLNFSEWSAYPPEVRRALLVASCADAAKGTMPMSAYLLFRPEARLSSRDVETICAAARGGGTSTAAVTASQPRRGR